MIRFEEFSFSYGEEQRRQGIRNVDLRIRPGECVLLCGSSGCGKSTLLKSVNGLIPHLTPGRSDGAVSVDGKPVKELPMYELAKRTASVFQNPKSQFFNTDVESEIVYSLENRGMSASEIDRHLEKTMKTLRLEELRGRSMFALSGGEKQQVAFAGAYISDAPVILLDEPTANLDGEAIWKLRSILREMKAVGKTVLIAEHRIAWLSELADTVYYMMNGRICRRWSEKEFFLMEEAERKNLGLRTLHAHAETVAEGESMKKNAEPRLEIRNLTLMHRERVVQQDLSCSLAPGAILGIIGMNGAGKTTLLRTLAGLAEPKAGKILLSGKPMRARERRMHFGMVMQDVNCQLFSDSCEKECRLGNPDVDSSSAKKLLAEVGLSELSEHHPQSLSGGQKQRLSFAVCKASHKDILLLDEPTGGLDYHGMRALGDALSSLAEEGKIVLVATHDMEFASTVCHRFLHLKKYRDLQRNKHYI